MEARYPRIASCHCWCFRTVANEPLRCGVEVADLEDAEDGAWLVVDGVREGPFDVVLVADGARSRLRERVTRVRRASRYPWGAVWAVVPQPEGWPWPLERKKQQRSK